MDKCIAIEIKIIALMIMVTVLPGLQTRAAQHNAPPQWCEMIQQQIQSMEYEVGTQTDREATGQSDALQAPNRANKFRVYFTNTGLRLTPRTAAGAAWEWGMELIAFGTTSQLPAVPPPVLSRTAQDNRVEYARTGALTEWYRNSKDGLEQGFSILEKPPGDGALVLDLAVTGCLVPRLQASENAIAFLSTSGMVVLTYAKLNAYDASGTPLVAHFSLLCPDRGSSLPSAVIRIVIEAARARYPVLVDPVIAAPAWSVHGNQESAQLGLCVAGAGDTNGDGYSELVVGVPFYDGGEENEGRALVFHGAPDGPAEDAAWTVEGNQANASMGYAAAGAGDVNGDGYADLIVSAVRYDNDEQDAGRVYLFYGTPGGLNNNPAWTAAGEGFNAQFGVSVAGAGDINGDGFSDVVVGALYGAENQGLVAVYYGAAAGLSPVPDWTAHGDQASSRFGVSVAGAGDVNGDGYADVLIGASLHDNTQTNEGRATLYLGAPGGLATDPVWTVYGGQMHAWLGAAAAGAGDVNGDGYADVAVGMHGWNLSDTTQDVGQVCVFHGAPGGLSAAPSCTLTGAQPNALFAHGLAGPGDVNGDGFADLLVGAPWHDNGQTDEGRAFLFLGSSTGLRMNAAWIGESDNPLAQYGYAVAAPGDLNGDGLADILVGANRYSGMETGEGRAFLYYGDASGLGTHPQWNADGGQVSARYGSALAGAGDVNGDGYDDFAVAAPQFDNGAENQGRVFLFHGAGSGPDATPAWFASGTQAGEQFGFSMAMAGDLNGDGYADLAVGAPWHHAGYSGEGQLCLYYGAPDGLPPAPSYSLDGGQEDAMLAWAVARAGDVNGDGFGDLLVGAPGYSEAFNKEGRAQVFLGAASGISDTPAFSLTGLQTGARYGAALAGAGDVNADGFSDILISAPYFDGLGADSGKTALYFGSPGGLAHAPAWTAEGTAENALLGFSIDSAGDVNGDGYSDILIGEPGFAAEQTGEGRVRLYPGALSGPAALAWEVQGGQSDAQLGAAVAGVGDLDADGFGDVLLGAPGYANGIPGQGRISAYHGAAEGLALLPEWTAEGGQANARWGHVLAALGDINGDGYADVAGAAPAYDGSFTDEGKVALFYGCGEVAGGRPVNPRQWQPASFAPIAPMGRSGTPGGVLLGALGITASGRAKVRLECELKPLGTPFDGLNVSLSSLWLDTGLHGAALTQPVTDLLADQPYHWRMRLRYWPGNAPRQPASRWFFNPYPGSTSMAFRTPAALVAAPTHPGATGFDTCAITWTWRDNADNETGFRLWADPGASPPITAHAELPEGTQSWRQDMLTPNTQYAFQVAAFTATAQSARTSVFTAWTLALSPAAPIVTHPTGHTLDIAINTADGNPIHTLYAVRLEPSVNDRPWVQSNGALGLNPVFLPAPAWNGVTVRNLDEAAPYTFCAIAQNGAGFNTDPGPGTLAETRDVTAPTAEVNLLSPPWTSANIIEYDICFSESLETTFESSHIQTADDSLSGKISLSGPFPPFRYRIAVQLANPDADGTLRLNIQGGATDHAGNPYAGQLSPECHLRNWHGFSHEPQDAFLYTGDDHILLAALAETGLPAACQWKKKTGNTIHNGPAAPTWFLHNVQSADEATYWCEVLYDGSHYASRAARLLVRDHVRIVEPPRGATIPIGAAHTFRARTEGGYPPLSYLWTHNDREAGYDPELRLPNAQLEHNGEYRVFVSDAFGDRADSRPVQLYVLEGMNALAPVSLCLLLSILAWTAHAMRRGKKP